MGEAQDFLEKFVKEVNEKTKYRHKFVIGYVGNLWDCGRVDERVWTIFCNAKPERSGFGGYRTGQLPELVDRLKKNGLHQLGRHFDIPELLDKKELKREAAIAKRQKKQPKGIDSIPFPPGHEREL